MIYSYQEIINIIDKNLYAKDLRREIQRIVYTGLNPYRIDLRSNNSNSNNLKLGLFSLSKKLDLIRIDDNNKVFFNKEYINKHNEFMYYGLREVRTCINKIYRNVDEKQYTDNDKKIIEKIKQMGLITDANEFNYQFSVIRAFAEEMVQLCQNYNRHKKHSLILGKVPKKYTIELDYKQASSI